MSVRYDCAVAAPRSRGIGQAIQVARSGDLVVLPTDTVYGLACDAFDARGYASLLRVKGVAAPSVPAARRGPSPVMIAHASSLTGIARGVSTELRALADGFWPGALTLVVHAQATLRWDLNPTIAVRVPLHPVALEVLERVGPMCVPAASAPGGNPPLTCADAQQQLGDEVDVYLDAGPVGGPGAGTDPAPLTSTVVDATGDRLRVVRTGSVGLAELRRIVPDLQGPDAEEAHHEGTTARGKGADA